MNTYFPIVLLCIVILAVLAIRAVFVMRKERDTPRGALPGKGFTTIDSSYFSGGGGGGHQSSFRVPRDPQDYAKRFVPRQKERPDGNHR